MFPRRSTRYADAGEVFYEYGGFMSEAPAKTGTGGGTGGITALAYRPRGGGALDHTVRARLVEVYHDNTTLSILGVNVACGLFVVASMARVAPTLVLVTWTALLTGSVMAAWLAQRAYAAAPRPIADPDRWARLFLLNSASTGTVWGLAALLFYDPANPVPSMFLAVVIAGMAAGGSTTKSSLWGCAFAFVMSQLALLALALVLVGEPAHQGFAGLIAVFAAAVMSFVSRNQNVLVHATRLTQENVDLLDRVAQSELHLRTIVDNASDLIALVDRDGVFRFHSPAAQRLLGYGPDALLGRPLGTLVHPDDLSGVADGFAAVLRDPQHVAGCEVRLRSRDGEWRYLTLSARALPPAEGREAAVVLSMQDATAQRRIQEALILAKERAEEAGRAKSDFLATMSHEIRTPMSGIVGLIELLKATGLSRKQQEYVRALDRAGEHLADLLNDILDFSKIEANKLESESVVFDLRRLIGTVMDIFRARAEEKGVTLRARISPELVRRWRGDARHLRQVLANLMGNAVKFTDSGHIELRVESDGTAPDGRTMLRWALEDTGIGIPEDKLPYVFDPFAQADTSTSRRHGGTGLGLTISRRLVELAGGRIWVVSRAGQGSTFFFTQPLEEVSSDVSEAVRLQGDEPRALPRGRVLVVDDSDLNRLVLGDMLSALGLTPVPVVNGREAVETFAARPDWDLVFMDIQMPVMDGFAAAAALRAIEQEQGRERCPVIALSATALKEDQERALAAGCDDYVVKPLRKDSLVALLRGRITRSAVPAGLPRAVPASAAAAAPGAGLPVIEPELAALLPSFFEAMTQELAAVARTIAAGEFRAAARHAHNAKGNAMLFGFQNAVDTLRIVEEAARGADADPGAAGAVVAAALADAEDEVAALRAAFPEAAGLAGDGGSVHG